VRKSPLKSGGRIGMIMREGNDRKGRENYCQREVEELGLFAHRVTPRRAESRTIPMFKELRVMEEHETLEVGRRSSWPGTLSSAGGFVSGSEEQVSQVRAVTLTGESGGVRWPGAKDRQKKLNREKTDEKKFLK